MKVYAINGSPRKNFNTATLLHSFLDGAASVGDMVETEMVHLYRLNFKGCTECYACKRKGGKFHGQCGYPDDITELLQDVSRADVVVFGSPIYFSDITGEMRCFLERLLYPYTSFQKDGIQVIAPRKIRTAFLYTMNVTEEGMKAFGYEQSLAVTRGCIQNIFGYPPETLYSYFTYQYDNYDQYVAEYWDLDAKKHQREEQFPIDVKKAYEFGKRLTELVQKESSGSN